MQKKISCWITWLDKNAIKIELILLSAAIVFGFLGQVLAIKFKDNELISKFYDWLSNHNLKDLLDLLDGLAVIVGGISYFIEDWAKKDQENKVYLFLIVGALFLAHIFQWLGLQYFSLVISLFNVLLILIPLECFIYMNATSSQKRAVRIEEKRCERCLK